MLTRPADDQCVYKVKSYLSLKPFDTLVQLPPELTEVPQAQDMRPDVEPLNTEPASDCRQFRLLTLSVGSVLLALSRGQQRLYTLKYTCTSDSWGLGCHAVFLWKSVIIRLIIAGPVILGQLLLLCNITSHRSLEMYVSFYIFNNVLDVICAKIQQAAFLCLDTSLKAKLRFIPPLFWSFSCEGLG